MIHNKNLLITRNITNNSHFKSEEKRNLCTHLYIKVSREKRTD